MTATVRITAGLVRGDESDRVRAFRGIPYGQAERFGPPKSVSSWDGVCDAREYGASSWQPADGGSGSEEIADLFGGRALEPLSEDCLFLNVWAPAHTEAPVPVIVFLHGGGHGVGSGSWPAYDGTHLAARGDVVVVTLNHRIGALGYLYLAELAGDEYATSGCNGILDIVEALRWVKHNISAFGGDPNHVVVCGQSGGAAKAVSLFSVPAAAGLFHRAALISTPTIRFQRPAIATDTAEQLLRHLRVSPAAVEDLRAIPPEDIVDAHLAVADLLTGFQPVVDGTHLTIDPVDAVASCAAEVPLMIGVTRDEYATFAPAVMTPSDADDRWVADQLRENRLVAEPLAEMLGASASDIVGVYRATRPSVAPHDLLVAIASDALFRIGTFDLADAKNAAAAAPVWMYRFDWETTAMFLDGAAHGVDTTFFFDNLDSAAVSRNGPGREQLAAQMSGALVAFAHSGNPNYSDLPAWPPYEPRMRSTMLFDWPSRVQDDPDADARRVWASLRNHSESVTR